MTLCPIPMVDYAFSRSKRLALSCAGSHRIQGDSGVQSKVNVLSMTHNNPGLQEAVIDATEEHLLLEAKLKQADAQAMLSSFSQQEGSHRRAGSSPKVHLRSDFEVVRAEVQLSRRQAWVLASSSHALDRALPLLGAAASKHAFLPGVKTAAADAVSYTCLVPTNHDLAAVLRIATQHIQRSSPLGANEKSMGVQGEAQSGDRSLSTMPHMLTASQMSGILDRSMGMLSPAYKAQAFQAAQKLSTALASTLKLARLRAERTATAARAQLQRLRHRHAVHAMQHNSMPSLLLVCLSGNSSVVGGMQRQAVPTVVGSLLKGQSQAAQSVVENAAVASLVEEAHGAEIPVLIILMTEDRNLQMHKAECAKAFQLSDIDRLVILAGKPASVDGFQLKRAVYDCLERGKQGASFRSKL